MRVAFCLPYAEWLRQIIDESYNDASSILLSYIAGGLAARGHQVEYFAPHDLNDLVYSSDLKSLANVPRTWTNNPLFMASRNAAWHVQQLMRIPYLNFFTNISYNDAYDQVFKDYDVVYERISLWSSAAARSSRRHGLPYVLFYDADQIYELDFTGQQLTGMQRRRAIQILQENLSTASVIICVSEQAKIDLAARWGVLLEKIVVLNNGVNVERFYPRIKDRPAIQAELGAAGKRPVYMFLGSFYQWHDVDTLLDAFCQVVEQVPAAHLVLVGDGPRRLEMQAKAERLGIRPSVTFYGYVAHNEVPRLAGAADVAVVPYPPLQQGLWLSPLKLFEFMASGAAIVASDLGQVSQVIQDGVNGLLVAPGNAQQMAAAMVRLADDDRLREQLWRNARQDAESVYSWDIYARRLEELLAAAIARQAKNSKQGQA